VRRDEHAGDLQLHGPVAEGADEHADGGDALGLEGPGDESGGEVR
jgi:hypothetical protein